jgi:hypothetical protein|tara:strand:- start:2435 stop:2653 length:219 start_codon:yes stop_codon:yes gene_type:complete
MRGILNKQKRSIYRSRNIHKEIDNLSYHQVKSRWYYIFWGIATVSVVVGQIYVGSGFRSMSTSVNQVLEKIK